MKKLLSLFCAIAFLSGCSSFGANGGLFGGSECETREARDFMANAEDRIFFAFDSSALSNNAVEVYGADPGIVNTGIITMHRWYDTLANIVFRPFIKSAKEGAEPIINAIRHRSSESAKKEYPTLFKNGSYYAFPKRIKRKYGRAAASMKF